jgi:O-antigen/teichoic acid export membrane protein
MITGLPQWLNFRLDQLLMIGLLDAEAIGLYVVAVAWGMAAQPLASAVAHLAVPTLAGSGDAQERAHAVYRFGTWVSIAVSALLLMTTPVLLPLVFGAEFRPAVVAALVMVVAGAIAAVNSVGAECLRGLGRPKSPLLAECAGLAVAGASLPVLIPVAGIVGAAIASVLSYSAILIVQQRLLATEPAPVIAVHPVSPACEP